MGIHVIKEKISTARSYIMAIFAILATTAFAIPRTQDPVYKSSLTILFLGLIYVMKKASEMYSENMEKLGQLEDGEQPEKEEIEKKEEKTINEEEADRKSLKIVEFKELLDLLKAIEPLVILATVSILLIDQTSNQRAKMLFLNAGKVFLISIVYVFGGEIVSHMNRTNQRKGLLTKFLILLGYFVITLSALLLLLGLIYMVK